MRLVIAAIALAALSASALAAPATYECAFDQSPTPGDWPASLMAQIDIGSQVVELEAGGESFRFVTDPATGYEFDVARDEDGTIRGQGYGPRTGPLLFHVVVLRPEGRLEWVAQQGDTHTASFWTCTPA